MAHQHEDLVRELAELREEVRQMRREVGAMKILQQAARIILGEPFTELIEDEPR